MQICIIGTIKQSKLLHRSLIGKSLTWRLCHNTTFKEFYLKTTGHTIPERLLSDVKKHHPNIQTLTNDRLQWSLQILKKFSITPLEACHDIHVFSMHPISLDNYGEILKECGFIKIIPKYLIRYHTLVRSRTIAQLKKQGLLKPDLQLEALLHSYFPEWPENETLSNIYSDTSNILSVRLNVLQNYLQWKLLVTPEDFAKYCKHYLPLKHKPMSDIKEAIHLAQNIIKFDLASIRRNGFIISSDPVNTKLILENVKSIAGMDITEAIKIEPAILKNNYSAITKIRSLMEEYRIPEEAQKKCLKVYCMHPDTVQERLDELKSFKEYQILKTNPRILSLVIHKKKMMNRLEKMHENSKQCYSLNHLVSSNKVFKNYIGSFGSKVCGRDLVILICSSLNINSSGDSEKQQLKTVQEQLKRHKFWLNSSLDIVNGNIQFLKRKFTDDIIFHHCQLLLYPMDEIEKYVNYMLKLKNYKCVTESDSIQLDSCYNSLEYKELSDDQILSLVLYEIEKRYHFSGDGIWSKQDGVRTDASVS